VLSRQLVVSGSDPVSYLDAFFDRKKSWHPRQSDFSVLVEIGLNPHLEAHGETLHD
jgi:hypothetical protein